MTSRLRHAQLVYKHAGKGCKRAALKALQRAAIKSILNSMVSR